MTTRATRATGTFDVLFFCFGIALAPIGCSSGDGDPTPDPVDSADGYVLRTDEITVAARAESYVCYAETLDHDIVVGRFDYRAQPLVHHLLLMRTMTPEPDGLSECDVLFRPTWLPMFGAATADTSLDLPSDVGMRLTAGTQVLVQLHLLNASDEDRSVRVEMLLGNATREDVAPAGLFAFGRTELYLPPRERSTTTHECQLEEDVDIFAVLPHMHYLGTALWFETGDTTDTMSEVYRREPWSFDDQFIELAPMRLPAGTSTRVSCAFDNPYAHPVMFGESSEDEMCFLVTFARNRTGLVGCDSDASVTSVPPDPAAGVCGEHSANDNGIGAPCSRGGNECATGLSCSLDQPQAPEDGVGFCLQIGGCATDDDCGGGGATCCAPAQAGGLLNICIPEACRPADCIPE